MHTLVIWGASGHGKVVADIVRFSGGFDLVGFLVDERYATGLDNFQHLPLFVAPQDLVRLRSAGVSRAIVAIGDCSARMRVAQTAIRDGFTLASAVHPRATVAADAHIGAGVVIAAGAVVNPSCVIGANVIVNTGATIDHDCVIADGVHISPGCHLGGGVRVGAETWIGIGSVVRDHVEIGCGTVIGAGSVVVKDIPDRVLAYGAPARVVGQRDDIPQNLHI